MGTTFRAVVFFLPTDSSFEPSHLGTLRRTCVGIFPCVCGDRPRNIRLFSIFPCTQTSSSGIFSLGITFVGMISRGMFRAVVYRTYLNESKWQLIPHNCSIRWLKTKFEQNDCIRKLVAFSYTSSFKISYKGLLYDHGCDCGHSNPIWHRLIQMLL